MIRLAVRVRASEAELVLAELLELAPSGVEERALPGEIVEYAIYGAPGEIPALPDLTAAAGGALVEIATEEVADDWAERWRAFHQPLVLGDALTVRPPWTPRGDTRLDVVIDPGQAFGTGAHATTRLCLELLLELPPAGPLLDLGCGSGVLAIAAAKLGWEPVIALDYDAAAVTAAELNAAANDVALEVRRHDLRRDPLPPVPTILANLLRPLLVTLAGRLEQEPPPRTMIASGLLRHEADEVAAALGARGLHEVARPQRGEWAALLMQSSAVTGDPSDAGPNVAG